MSKEKPKSLSEEDIGAPEYPEPLPLKKPKPKPPKKTRKRKTA